MNDTIEGLRQKCLNISEKNHLKRITFSSGVYRSFCNQENKSILPLGVYRSFYNQENKSILPFWSYNLPFCDYAAMWMFFFAISDAWKYNRRVSPCRSFGDSWVPCLKQGYPQVKHCSTASISWPGPLTQDRGRKHWGSTHGILTIGWGREGGLAYEGTLGSTGSLTCSRQRMHSWCLSLCFPL